MSDPVLARLSKSDRKMLEALAAGAGVDLEAITAAATAQYLRLLRDAPAALPRDPLRGLAGQARRAQP